MTTPFWIEDPHILLKKEHMTKIWPKMEMSFNEKLNAITRFILYLSVLGGLFSNNIQIPISGVITIGCIILLYHFKKNSKEEGFIGSKLYELTKETYTNPTVKNPIMNVLLPERKDNPNRKPAAPSYIKEVETQINNDTQDFVASGFDDPKIKEKLFQDLGDSFNFDRSMRQWYSTANTQIPSDQKSFAEWCYGDMISCKEGNEFACTRSAPPRWTNH